MEPIARVDLYFFYLYLYFWYQEESASTPRVNLSYTFNKPKSSRIPDKKYYQSFQMNPYNSCNACDV